MAGIIALANQKGGVGKTTTTLNLGTALAQQGRRVLLVDIDPQASLTDSVGIDTVNLRRSTYEVLRGELSLFDILQPIGMLTIAPATIDLAAAELQLASEIGRERLLINALVRVSSDYDDILIDCPPSLGLLTVNALTSATWVLVPTEGHYLALRGLTQLMESLQKVQERTNPALELLGILPTRFDGRTTHETEVLEALHERFPGRVFEPIPRSIRFAEAPVASKAILEYDPSHPGAEAYRALAEEVLRRVT